MKRIIDLDFKICFLRCMAAMPVLLAVLCFIIGPLLSLIFTLAFAEAEWYLWALCTFTSGHYISCFSWSLLMGEHEALINRWLYDRHVSCYGHEPFDPVI